MLTIGRWSLAVSHWQLTVGPWSLTVHRHLLTAWSLVGVRLPLTGAHLVPGHWPLVADRLSMNIDPGPDRGEMTAELSEIIELNDTMEEVNNFFEAR